MLCVLDASVEYQHQERGDARKVRSVMFHKCLFHKLGSGSCQSFNHYLIANGGLET